MKPGGRAGGRSITFNVLSPGSFATLAWGGVSGTAPGAAFDLNGITANTAEVMTFDATSNLAGGIARWNGSAFLQLATGP